VTKRLSFESLEVIDSIFECEMKTIETGGPCGPAPLANPDPRGLLQ